MKNFVGRRRFLRDSEGVSGHFGQKIGKKLSQTLAQKWRLFRAFWAKMAGKKVKRFDSHRDFEKEMKNREGIAFFCFCFLVFCLSVGMTFFSIFQYQQKVKDLEKLQRYTNHLKKDNLLLAALSEEEKRSNQLSLAVDYGYAFSQDLVIALQYPEVDASHHFYFLQLFSRHWQYLMMLAAVIAVLFLHKYLGFFADEDRQELALQRLSTVFPSLIHEMPASSAEKTQDLEIKKPSSWVHSPPSASKKTSQKGLFSLWREKWRFPSIFLKKREKSENAAKTSYFRYFRSHFYQQKKNW